MSYGPQCWNCGTYYVTEFIGGKHYCSECADKLRTTKRTEEVE